MRLIKAERFKTPAASLAFIMTLSLVVMGLPMFIAFLLVTPSPIPGGVIFLLLGASIGGAVLFAFAFWGLIFEPMRKNVLAKREENS